MADLGEHTELSLAATAHSQHTAAYVGSNPPDDGNSAKIGIEAGDSIQGGRGDREGTALYVEGRHLPTPHPDPLLAATAGTLPAERARLLHEAEERANEFLARDDGVLEAVVYKTLYARGLRIGTIDASIRSALDRKLGRT